MAFPPNYGQERRGREAAKQRKALEKQMRRKEKSASRHQEVTAEDAAQNAAPAAELKKDM